jgi:hypothetical protein
MSVETQQQLREPGQSLSNIAAELHGGHLLHSALHRLALQGEREQNICFSVTGKNFSLLDWLAAWI